MGNIAPRLDGEWIERSGRIWRASQSGNTFQWVQDGTNRNATGIAVPLNGGLQWVLFATFDGHANMKFTPSVDGSQLVASTETFTRIHSMNYSTTLSQPASTIIHDVPPLIGADFVENSGKIWKCTMHEGGHFILKNQTDGRICDTFAVRDTLRNVFVVYLVFQNQGSEQIFKVETMDINMLQLPNGDCFRRNTLQPPMQQQQPPMYQPMYPTTNQPPMYPPYQQPNVPQQNFNPYQPFIQPNVPYQQQPPMQQQQPPMQPYQQPPVYQQPVQPFIQQPVQPVIQQQPYVQPVVQQQPKTRYYRIGGGKDGITNWTRWNGSSCNSAVEGWEMVFEVDANGNVSGSNKNDSKNAIRKHYSGFFRNNTMDVTARWDDGRTATYKGSVTGNKVRLDFVITAVGTQGGNVSDCGFNTGTLFETSNSPSESRSFNISGKTFWTKWNGSSCNSEVDGWKMSFDVDKFGNVSGRNKNAGQSYAKTYSGTFLNNFMDVTAKWEDGRVATYKGTLTGDKIRLDFVITAVGTQGGRSGDSGFNMGTVEIK